MNTWYAYTDLEIVAEWGNRIRLARMERNLTQQQLADRSGLNRSTIRDIESGKSAQLLSLIAVFRGLEMLHQLEGLLSGVAESPVLENIKQTRQRVRHPKNT